MATQKTKERKQAKQKTPTFLLELPLQVEAGQAKRIRGHLEAGRAFYNTVLSEGQRRLRQMRADAAWQGARAIPRTHKQERQAAFSALREQYGFSEYALHEYAKQTRVSWIAEHLDAVLAQTLATRAYQALGRVCVGKARRVRFKSRGRGLSSIENKRNDTGLRFVLHTPEEGKQGYLIWKDDQLAAIIDWNDPVVKYGLDHRIKFARLVQRKGSSPKAQGADAEGFRYCVQLALEGVPYHKPKHTVGTDILGADLGPSTIALVPQQAEASLEVFCEELARMRRRSGGCNARWSDNGEQPILTISMRKGASDQLAARRSCAGTAARPTRGPVAGRLPKNANWLRTARACMAKRSTRS
jgi:hypothetical protein